MGYGDTRFASPTDAFKVLYIAAALATSVAEAVVPDRFQGKARRRLAEAEAGLWGATSVTASRSLQLIDLRTTGLLRLGVSTEAARGKAQSQGRKLSQAVHDRTDADGFLYVSRLTAAPCVCVYDRAVPALQATPVAPLTELAGFIPALRALNITLEPSP